MRPLAWSISTATKALDGAERPVRTFALSSRPFKGSCHISDKIVRMFDTDRCPDQSRRNPDHAPRYLCSAIETQDAGLAARIEVAADTVADLDRRLGQIDTAIEEAAKRGRTNAALSAMGRAASFLRV
jgi:hypothetical protein